MNEKKIYKSFREKNAMALALCVRVFALISVNTACTIPYYEPEQPDALKRLRVRC